MAGASAQSIRVTDESPNTPDCESGVLGLSSVVTMDIAFAGCSYSVKVVRTPGMTDIAMQRNNYSTVFTYTKLI